MTFKRSTATPRGYRPLSPSTIHDYLAGHKDIARRLGGAQAGWRAREVGDGNLNLVFIVEGPEGSVVVKQALPYLRIVGEAWPLPLSRAYYEHLALKQEALYAPRYVPGLYHYDDKMALTVMEYLTPHIILRKGLIQGIRYPQAAKHLGEFMALTLYHTSDLAMPAATKKEKTGLFLGNTALCKITEDLIFNQPYMTSSFNRWTTPQLDDAARSFRHDAPLKLAAQELKWKFLNHAEALLHGDLHTGSVMVTQTDTRAIDPEFAFYGPMGFDVGAMLANLLLSYFSQAGHAVKSGERDAYAGWVVEQTIVLWESFSTHFTSLWQAGRTQDTAGDAYHPHVIHDTPELATLGIKARLHSIWSDALGFAGLKMNRRIFGLAHVEDMESISDPDIRASCERRALQAARELILNRQSYASPQDIVGLVKDIASSRRAAA